MVTEDSTHQVSLASPSSQTKTKTTWLGTLLWIKSMEWDKVFTTREEEISRDKWCSMAWEVKQDLIWTLALLIVWDTIKETKHKSARTQPLTASLEAASCQTINNNNIKRTVFLWIALDLRDSAPKPEIRITTRAITSNKWAWSIKEDKWSTPNKECNQEISNRWAIMLRIKEQLLEFNTYKLMARKVVKVHRITQHPWAKWLEVEFKPTSDVQVGRFRALQLNNKTDQRIRVRLRKALRNLELVIHKLSFR